MTIPRPIKILGNTILVFFALLGGILTLAQLPSVWQPSDSKTIIVLSEDTTLVAQGVFTSFVEFQGEQVGQNQLVETTVTLWRDGGAPIGEDMLRRPLEIRMPPGSKVASAKIVDVDSSVPSNFKLETADNSVNIRWQVFDPDMAVKIAIARFGSLDPVALSETVGPGVTTTTNRYNFAKTIYWWGITLISLITAVSIFAISANLEASAEQYTKHLPKPAWFLLHFTLRAAPVVLVGAAFAVGPGVLIWLQELVVPPIPFS